MSALDDVLAKLDTRSGPAPAGRRIVRPTTTATRRSRSLSDKGDPGVVVHCHAGCTPEQITAAVGMTVADLFDKRATRRQPSAASWPPTTTTTTTAGCVPSGPLRPEGLQSTPTRRSRRLEMEPRRHPTRRRTGCPNSSPPTSSRQCSSSKARRTPTPWPPRAASPPATRRAPASGRRSPRSPAGARGRDVIVVADKDDAGLAHARDVRPVSTARQRRDRGRGRSRQGRCRPPRRRQNHRRVRKSPRRQPSKVKGNRSTSGSGR